MNRLLVVVLCLGPGMVQAQRPASPPAAPAPPWQAMLEAEDNRIATDAALAPLYQALASPDPGLAARAALGLGRLENARPLPRLLPLLADSRPAVRAAVAFALAQIGQDSALLDGVAPVLIDRLREETDPEAIGGIARAVGRLPYRTAERAQAALAALETASGRTVPAATTIQTTRALESFLRLSGRLVAVSPALVTRIRILSTWGGADAESAARIRRAATAALTRLIPPDDPTLLRMAGDQADEVRRLAVAWAAESIGVAGRRDYLAGALSDRSPLVRLQAVRAWARWFQGDDCQPVLKATRDRDFKVALEAIDALGTPCSTPTAAGDLLWALVDSLVGARRGDFTGIASWHRGAHALVSLARIAPARVEAVLSRAGASATWQVRLYAARAAGITADPERLLSLAEDPNDNVREAAIAGLLGVRGHGADTVFRAALARPDYQLLITAARVLAGTPDRRRAAASLLAALTRVTAERKETSRDPRLAILERLAEVGGAEDTLALEPLLEDFDPVVAARASELLSRWSGRPRPALPRPLPKAPLDAAAIARLEGARLRVTMAPTAGGGVFDVELLAALAPATVARIVTRARDGYYDGLTFHRVVANFVIQGGSPRANEYAGDALYMRDEVGPLSHERGTLGISTRGRDTGDAQIFVNLIDNLRLDFNYTVWGRVVAGLDVVDAILEGDVIDRMDVVDAGGSGGQP